MIMIIRFVELPNLLLSILFFVLCQSFVINNIYNPWSFSSSSSLSSSSSSVTRGVHQVLALSSPSIHSLHNMQISSTKNSVSWIVPQHDTTNIINSVKLMETADRAGPTFTHQSYHDAISDCYIYLLENMMPCDVINSASLGFHADFEKQDDETQQQSPMTTTTKQRRTLLLSQQQPHLPDGLSNGIVNNTIHLALETKLLYPWTEFIPKHIFMEYVLPYAVINEPRTNWRPYLTEAIQPIVQKLISMKDTSDNSHMDMDYDHQNPIDITIEQVVREINKSVWSLLGKPTIIYNHTDGTASIQNDPILFKASQTPLIYDPMSILQYGYASCTGLSILLIAALRCAGIPARLVGTPAWNNMVEKGNHNWIEVYSTVKNEWIFMEPAYGDYGTDQADHMDKNPCTRWFCNANMFHDTKVYASRYTRKDDKESYHYPMAWDIDNPSVVGFDRTQYYLDICSKC